MLSWHGLLTLPLFLISYTYGGSTTTSKPIQTKRAWWGLKPSLLPFCSCCLRIFCSWSRNNSSHFNPPCVYEYCFSCLFPAGGLCGDWHPGDGAAVSKQNSNKSLQSHVGTHEGTWDLDRHWDPWYIWRRCFVVHRRQLEIPIIV